MPPTSSELESIPEPFRLATYDYVLPPERIAQQPAGERDAARLLVLEQNAELCHARFDEIGRWLRRGDLLVLNDTAVIPARLLARKRATGGRVEVFLLRPRGAEWDALIRGSARVGQALVVADDAGAQLDLTVTAERGGGLRTVRIAGDLDPAALLARLKQVGRVPLPPYIRRDPTPVDRDRYQTCYAAAPGSVAAPTAGLHFTPALLAALQRAGVGVATLTLHVGAGTFRPVTVDDIRRHALHSEPYWLPSATTDAIAATHRGGGRVIAVGTTSLRVLEAAAADDGRLRPGTGETALFIYPGYRLRAVDGLITNFHLPRSTLLMLVTAFAGLPRIRAAYRSALATGYRFLSYGDAMLIL
jgi:S-adenosylmethionine:tRNA ribosyltransferase-isomerase